jgi:hypothetical protein
MRLGIPSRGFGMSLTRNYLVNHTLARKKTIVALSCTLGFMSWLEQPA